MCRQNDFWTTFFPFGPRQCSELNVAGDVQDVCFERAGLKDDVPSIQPAFTEVRCFNPHWLGLFRPDIDHLLKRLLNAEVAEGAFFAKEPGDVHASKTNAPNGYSLCLKGLFR